MSWPSGSTNSGAAAVLVTGGHGADAVDHLFDGERHVEIPVERHDVAATHGAGCTHSATLAAYLARAWPLEDAARAAAAGGFRCSCARPRRARPRRGTCRRSRSERGRVSVSPGTTLRLLRERKPLVHQITNYVVMNETANATLALGALPVMAHAREEVEEMVGLAGALVLNIGTLSPQWVDAMLAAGQGGERGRRARRARSRRRRRHAVPHGHRAADPRARWTSRVLRGNQGEIATLVGVDGGGARRRVDRR